jgi:streptogramin lyase
MDSSRLKVRQHPALEDLEARSLLSGITVYPLPSSGADPVDIAEGPDGALWFTEYGAGAIGRITPTGTITQYLIPTAASAPLDITVGPDGALWFTENSGNKIGRITTAGVITEYTIPTAGSGPAGITTGPDGALWFTEPNAHQVGRLTTAGAFTEYSNLAPGTQPAEICAGPDGALWFTENNKREIGRITTAGAVNEYPLPTPGAHATDICTGPDGALWFTESNKSQLGRMTTAGVVTEYPTPTGGSAPTGITSGPDGALWFTESSVGQLGRITTTGVVTEYPTSSSSSGPTGITSGPGGTLWFAESSAGMIANASPTALPPPIATSRTSVYGQEVSFTATISGALGTPTGTVTFLDGTNPLATIALSGGTATFRTTSLSAGTHVITVRYNGSILYPPTVSNPLYQHVTPAPLVVTANNLSRTYGATLPKLTYTYSGLVNGDTSAVFRGQLATTATPGANAGSYAITQGALDAGPNYTVSFTPGTLSITPAPLSVTANDARRPFGQPNPAFTVTYQGLVNNDTPSSLGGTLSFSTTASPTSTVGAYSITPGGLTSSNYTITFLPGTLTVVPESVAVSGAAVACLEGVAFTGEVATFRAPDATPSPQNYSAWIQWGDGHQSAGTVAFDPVRGVYTVTGSNTYRTEGVFAVHVTVQAGGADSGSASGLATVSDVPLVATGAKNIVAVQGTPFTAVVAAFTMTIPSEPETDFTAAINWGDGTSTPGTVEFDSRNAVYQVSGSHVYLDSGTYPVETTVFDDGRSLASARGTAHVLDAPVHATGKTLELREGAAFDVVVATFTDGDPRAAAADYTAAIDWGDGRSSAGTVVQDRGTGVFSIMGAGTYAASGRYRVRVTIQEQGGTTTRVDSLAQVSDATEGPTISAVGLQITATAGVSFSGPVGAFVAHRAADDPTQYQAMINWGDGESSTATITRASNGVYEIVGSHVYATSGNAAILLEISQDNGPTTSAQASAVVVSSRPVPLPSPGPAVPTAAPTPPPSSSQTIPNVVAAPWVPTSSGAVPVLGIVSATPMAVPPAAVVPAVNPGVHQAVASAPALLPGVGEGDVGPAVDAGDAAWVGVVGGEEAGAVVALIVRPQQGNANAGAAIEGGANRAGVAGVGRVVDEAAAIVAMLDRQTPTATAGMTDPRGDRVYPREVLWTALDQLDREVASLGPEQALEKVVGVTVVAYAGYVLVSSRSGLWLLSLLMARPLWKQFDPLQVLLDWEEEQAARRRGGRDDDETLQSMVDPKQATLRECKGRKDDANQHRPRQPHRKSAALRPRAGAPSGSRRRGPRRAKSAL